jgi:hypothetical protein
MLACGNHTCSLLCHRVEQAPNEVAVSNPIYSTKLIT